MAPHMCKVLATLADPCAGTKVSYVLGHARSSPRAVAGASARKI